MNGQIPNIIKLVEEKNIEEVKDIFIKIIYNTYESSFNKSELIEEFYYLLNKINQVIINEDSSENIKLIEKVLESFKINNKFATFLYEEIKNSKKRNLINNFVHLDWQISTIEKENEKTSVNVGKLDKVEIALDIKTCSNDVCQTDMIKMNYNEFSEIFQNLKKINEQLHLFKN